MSDRGLMIVPKEYRAHVRVALRRGWTLQVGRGGHPTLTSPNGAYKTPIPSTSTDGSLLRAFVMRLRKGEHQMMPDNGGIGDR